jgi:hypothetical protein
MMHRIDAAAHGSRLSQLSRRLAAGVLGFLTALPALAESPDSQTLELFAPGIVSGPANDGSPTFTPDGQSLLFTRSGAGAGTILESHRVRTQWTTPRIAAFSGQWNDQHPSMAPDGSYLVFVSTRPVPGVEGRVAHIWRVDRLPHGWAAPVHLPAEVNIGPRTYAPSVAADNTLYFLEIDDKHQMQLYRSRWLTDHYESAEPLPFSTPASADVDPEIAPDQSFLIFASAGRRPNDTREHLYIVFNHGGHWSEVKPLRYPGDDDNGWSTDNEPNLAPDGQALYFSSDRSLALHFPRTLDQARADLSRIDAWDNGATNVWKFSIRDIVQEAKSAAAGSGNSGAWLRQQPISRARQPFARTANDSRSPHLRSSRWAAATPRSSAVDTRSPFLRTPSIARNPINTSGSMPRTSLVPSRRIRTQSGSSRIPWLCVSVTGVPPSV